jgi:hypothetical protein
MREVVVVHSSTDVAAVVLHTMMEMAKVDSSDCHSMENSCENVVKTTKKKIDVAHTVAAAAAVVDSSCNQLVMMT